MDFTLWDILRVLLASLRWTVALSLVAFVCGGALAFAIMWLRLTPARLPRGAAAAFIELFQGTPLLMQLFIVFFGIALFGFDVPAWLAAGLAVSLWSAAFLAEIWRGCIEAVPRGQWESSASLAMTRMQQYRHIVLPQACRLAVAPTVGFCVQIVKNTSVTSIIGFVELTKAGTMISNTTFRPLETFGLVALMYFLLCSALSALSRHLEKHFNAPYRN
ncbi:MULTISPECIES: amino acid ABC transporter permease [unclassified Caballeronia]|uniref:amino acid ABC transporter permease n=1 Tax=unclassified Caballeronia TaxID=2646786 RepID=UPI002860017E|nr:MULTISPECIES: amino acid ABC transporter permease [unclassified Caballeronia]MDR5815535.1 amino acid ABC transporter permease [Caballeronia sp. LZ033]MDR5822107.1 amino acid ABC transporter permease [Caballeronia sp. LZ043]MDR5880263.1 amino acid ABC transporter permease [Caballeronia sp. LZ032]